MRVDIVVAALLLAGIGVAQADDGNPLDSKVVVDLGVGGAMAFVSVTY